MKVLVTGGAGFLGSHIVDQLVADGHDVTILDDLSGGSVANASGSKSLFVKGSVCDVEHLERLFRNNKYDWVFHLAAYAAEGLSPFIRRFNYTNNLIGSVNLINVSIRHHVKCFVFTSSIAVYGSGQTPFTEEMTPRPEDPYGIAKYAVELDLAAAYRQFGLPYIIFRPHNVYGERQNLSDPYRNVIGIFMNQIMHGKPLTIFGDGQQTRAFSHVSDVAPVIARAPTFPLAYNEIFNIGADAPFTVRRIADEVLIAMGRERGFFRPQPSCINLPARREVEHAFSDHHKLWGVFHTSITTPIAAGLRQMAKWAVHVGSQSLIPLPAPLELTEGLPESWATRRSA